MTPRSPQLVHPAAAPPAALAAFQAPYLEEKLLAEGVFDDAEAYEVAFREFKRYAWLASRTEGSLPMTSEAVDDVWHQFILFTREYHTFCERFLDGYLHHRPRTSLTPLAPGGRERFVDAYEEAFGPVPAIWREGRADCKADCGCEEGSCEGA